MELATVLLGLDTLGRAAGMHVDLGLRQHAGERRVSKRLRDAYDARAAELEAVRPAEQQPRLQAEVGGAALLGAGVQAGARGQEFSYGGMTDGVEKYALATYGRIIAITRQALINDDLGAFDRLPMMLGRAGGRARGQHVLGILTANAAMNDTSALFHADHGNLPVGTRDRRDQPHPRRQGDARAVARRQDRGPSR
jgi:hypothetical protein